MQKWAHFQPKALCHMILQSSVPIHPVMNTAETKDNPRTSTWHQLKNYSKIFSQKSPKVELVTPNAADINYQRLVSTCVRCHMHWVSLLWQFILLINSLDLNGVKVHVDHWKVRSTMGWGEPWNLDQTTVNLDSTRNLQRAFDNINDR